MIAIHGTGAIRRPPLGILALYALAVLIYALLLTNGQLLHARFAPLNEPTERLNLVFNSMAVNLLHGRFDVDPAIVGYEGFAVDGKVIAYWGISFALIRLPLVVFPGGLQVDVTALSCLIAVCIAAGAKLRTLGLIFGRLNLEQTGFVYWLIAVTILFSGPQIEFLKSSTYQEVCLWAGALCALFVYRALAGLLMDRFPTKSLCSLAAIAGLTLLSRVSTGIGLYASCALLLAAIAVSDATDTRRWSIARLLDRRMLLPVSILIAFAGAVGFVNYQRWGNPLVFADYHRYIHSMENPQDLERLVAYGPFNLRRVPLSLLYYLFPVWVFPRPEWNSVFQVLQARLFDFTELPPSTFMLTDALLVGFFAYAIRALCMGRLATPLKPLPVLALMAGFCAPCVLMLTAMSMSFRYRIEFYPLLEFVAFLGMFQLLARTPRPASKCVKHLVSGGSIVSVGASAGVLLLYKLSPFGPGIPLVRAGFWALYAERWHVQLDKLIHSFH